MASCYKAFVVVFCQGLKGSRLSAVGFLADFAARPGCVFTYCLGVFALPGYTAILGLRVDRLLSFN